MTIEAKPNINFNIDYELFPLLQLIVNNIYHTALHIEEFLEGQRHELIYDEKTMVTEINIGELYTSISIDSRGLVRIHWRVREKYNFDNYPYTEKVNIGFDDETGNFDIKKLLPYCHSELSELIELCEKDFATLRDVQLQVVKLLQSISYVARNF